ncbi:hypothetical protein ABZ616_05060, partial [Streptomyces noursei]
NTSWPPGQAPAPPATNPPPGSPTTPPNKALLDAARARGRVGGRPTVATPEIIRAARDLLPNPENSITSIANLLGVSPGTLSNHIPDLRELRTSGRIPGQLTTS